MRKQNYNSKKEDLADLLSGKKKLSDLLSYEFIFYVLHNGVYTNMKTGEVFSIEEDIARKSRAKTLVVMPDNGRRLINKSINYKV